MKKFNLTKTNRNYPIRITKKKRLKKINGDLGAYRRIPKSLTFVTSESQKKRKKSVAQKKL